MTFTVLGTCRTTGEIGIGSATASIAVGARLGQWIRAGGNEWVVASQAIARPGLGFETGDLLAAGTPLGDLETALLRLDPHLAYRQLGVLAKDGGHFIYTGEKASDWKGHQTGDGFMVFGNMLAGADVVAGMAEGFGAAPDQPLAERLMRALEGGRDAGGQMDHDGNHVPELSAFVRVLQADADPFVYGGGRSPVLDLRIDHDANAVSKLRQLLDDCRRLREVYELRARDPETYLRDAARWELDLNMSKEP